MKFNPISLLIGLLLASSFLTASGQERSSADDSRFQLQLRSGSFTPSKNISEDKVAEFNRRGRSVNGSKFTIIQFESIPTEAQRAQLKQAGIELLEYIPNNAYTASVKGNLSQSLLIQANARAVVDLNPEQKMQPELVNGNIPGYAVKSSGTVDVWISFSRNFSLETVTKELTEGNFDMIPTAYEAYRVIGVRVSTGRLTELAAFPFIEFVEVAPKGDQLLNNRSIVFDRANVLNASIPGGRNLQGQGVVLGVGDDANPLRHIDFTGRLINRAAIAGGAHGLHVMGTAAGAGIIDERYKGHAPKATIVAQNTSNILAFASTYVNDYGMVVTNNSYGNTAGVCAFFGYYDILARIVDQQAFEMPNLQHVFSAGNSGGSSCAPYPAGFRTVIEGFQASKNTISVGNATEAFGINSGSSKGPVRDGRIKPEVVAFGTNVMSAWVPDIYILNGGTSMSSPAVAGGLVLLYQRYRQLNSGANPRNALMKALVCNGATDVGNAGPDFSSGFGYPNLLRSVKMIENNNYFNDSVNASGTKTHTLSVPAGLAQLKIMLYWNDSAATALASHTLVNDLDLEVTDPSSGLHLPFRLDTLPANVNNVATTAADHINNIEQVVINNPAAGTWSFAVKGTTIPFAPRYEYFLVYDTIPVSATLTFPVGGERLRGGSAVLKNGDSVFVSWDAYGNPASTFTLQYSVDNGATWITDTTVSANVRMRKWFVPDVATDQARVKLIWNGTGLESVSQPFTILGVPDMTTSQCEGYILLSWSAVTGATDYEVMILRGDDMVPLGTTLLTNYTISGLSRDSAYYVAVRARINGSPGRRCPAPALGITPNGATCTGTISDNDMKMDAIISPANSGRRLTSTELSNAVSVTIRIKNLDDVATTGDIPVSYKIGSNPAVNETIVAPNIAGGSTFNYTFTTTADLASVGSYDFVVRVSYPGDPVVKNDTIAKTFKQLDNAFVDLNAADYLDNIESATEQSWLTNRIGLDGLDRYDFQANTSFGRIRTFVNTGIARSGTRALTLDAERYHPTGTGDSLKATFNLQGFSPGTEDVRLDFFFKHHKQLPDAANKVWVRGNDQAPWIEIYDLDDNQGDAGEFIRTPSLEISDVLAANSQTFSSSFQIRWGQFGLYPTADNFGESGYTFDDIHLYIVEDDIQMISIDTPIVASCNLSNATPVRITIRNSDNSVITNVPVKFQIDGNTAVPDIIPSIAANTSITYTFTPTADLSAPGTHTIRVWADLGTDTYRDNDTVEVIIENAPLISTFPYLQNFEAGAGYWHSDGQNNSWEYGTPASPKINTAASGSKAWKTSLNGSYNNSELSYLYSPCFNISALANPRLSLSIALDLEDCGGGGLCDGAYVEYSSDGKTWNRLGAVGSGTNWYNRNYSGNQLWSVQDYTRWHVATTALPSGLTSLRLRFVVQSDPFLSFEGIGIDDIHIYDSVYGIYNGPPFTSAVVNQPAVNGTGWVDFVSGNKLIASVNPNGLNMGSTDVQAYIHTGAVRINTVQYYHNRNITIKPSTVNLADSATVRFYFLDSETESLINATGCAYCSKPRSAYELGVSKYSDANDALENGSLTDNTGGNWLFINAAKAVKVPFDKGYYAEFKVKDFSEFWLNNGGPDGNQTLPAELISFSATKKINGDVLTEWVTASENNIARYEIEVARSNEDYRQNQFAEIGEIAGSGNTSTERHYQYTDLEAGKTGVRYYRLKIVDQDARATYSLIRPVVFEENVRWDIYPNPSSGIFSLVYQANAGETMNMKVYDLNGKQVLQSRLPATGFVQKAEIDLSKGRFASGIYMLEVKTAEKTRVFKLIKK